MDTRANISSGMAIISTCSHAYDLKLSRFEDLKAEGMHERSNPMQNLYRCSLEVQHAPTPSGATRKPILGKKNKQG